MPNEKYYTLGNRQCLESEKYYKNTEKKETIFISEYSEQQGLLQEKIEGFNYELYNEIVEQNSCLWVDNEHISKKVESYYVVGEEQLTLNKIKFQEKYSGLFDLQVEHIMEEEYILAGDNTVLAYSASINDKYSDKTFFISLSHGNLTFVPQIYNSNNDCFGFINSIIRGSIPTYLSGECMGII